MKQAAKRPRKAGPQKDRKSSSARRRPRWAMRFRAALVISFLLPLLCLIVARTSDIPLGGAGALVYRFSPSTGLRLIRALSLVPLAAGMAGVIWMLGSAQTRRPSTARRALALAFAAVLAACIATATFLIPPAPLLQHFFNMTSYSQDGAFDAEARLGLSVRQYLKQFDHRLTLPISEMSGTRVLSNPPGTSLIAMGVRCWFPVQVNPPGWIERQLESDYGSVPSQFPVHSAAVRFAIALQCLWLASAFFLYLLGRQFLSPAGSVLFALVAAFNPSTADFAPGKDPAQLLTISIMLWLWFLAWRKTGIICILVAAGSGMALVVGLAFGLIHFWIAMAVLMACLWQGARDGCLRHVGLECALPAAIGAILVVIAAWIFLDWNIPVTLLAVARRFSSLQSEAMHYNRAAWFLIGLPIFLLFLSPGFCTPAWLILSRRAPATHRALFGRRLLICVITVMVVTYFAGVTYELPRLWVAFLPLLSLAPLIGRPLAVISSPRARRALAALAIAQILFTAIHVSMMDARETEWRIATMRGFS